MNYKELKDSAVLIGTNPEHECVYSSSMPVGDYWDVEHAWDNGETVKSFVFRGYWAFSLVKMVSCCSSLRVTSALRLVFSFRVGHAMRMALLLPSNWGEFNHEVRQLGALE